jgi:glyoxylase-like metal-dependent hydrolase (beta-lactamase superfamily II)/ferredoxin
VARLDLRNPRNAEGDWYVDTRCIDCGTCRDIAPAIFRSAGGTSVVAAQPGRVAAELRRVAAQPDPVGVRPGAETDAWLAAQACPTSSIGTQSKQPRPGRLYPHEIAPWSGVFDCGYCSESSFGASAWFVRRPEGNLLIDSPRFTEALAGPFAEVGGIARILLTHRDDVADAARWAERFGAEVWIHADDAGAAPFATDLVHGTDDKIVQAGVVAIPTAGHTRGSMMFLVDGTYLFTGDSLAWSNESGDLTAFRYACWYSWAVQKESLARLAGRHRFAWVLPGHGGRVHDDPDRLHDRLEGLVERMAGAVG